MNGYYGNIEKETLKNSFFRRVLFTGQHQQLVVMNLKPNQGIGLEAHNNLDQFFRFEQGFGKVVMNGTELNVQDGDSIVVPAGTEHNIINTSANQDLKLYTIYSPPNHPDGTIHKTLEEAMQAEEHH